MITRDEMEKLMSDFKEVLRDGQNALDKGDDKLAKEHFNKAKAIINENDGFVDNNLHYIYSSGEDGYFMPVLNTACEHKGAIEVVELILMKTKTELSKFINITSSTPLTVESKTENHYQPTMYKMERVNSQYFDAPLHVACRYGNTDIVKLLLEKGAKADKLNGYHPEYGAHTPEDIQPGMQTPLQIAEWKGHNEIAKLIDDKCKADHLDPMQTKFSGRGQFRRY